MRLKAEARGATSISWCVEDMLALRQADGSFDAVIEKGVFDVLLVCCRPPYWELPTQSSGGRLGVNG